MAEFIVIFFFVVVPILSSVRSYSAASKAAMKQEPTEAVKDVLKHAHRKLKSELKQTLADRRLTTKPPRILQQSDLELAGRGLASRPVTKLLPAKDMWRPPKEDSKYFEDYKAWSEPQLSSPTLRHRPLQKLGEVTKLQEAIIIKEILDKPKGW